MVKLDEEGRSRERVSPQSFPMHLLPSRIKGQLTVEKQSRHHFGLETGFLTIPNRLRLSLHLFMYVALLSILHPWF